jgi:hypothetical protein
MRGLALRDYSHEMLVSFVRTRYDPLDGPSEEVCRLWGDHPALQFLDGEERLHWPERRISINSPPSNIGHSESAPVRLGIRQN